MTTPTFIRIRVSLAKAAINSDRAIAEKVTGAWLLCQERSASHRPARSKYTFFTTDVRAPAPRASPVTGERSRAHATSVSGSFLTVSPRRARPVGIRCSFNSSHSGEKLAESADEIKRSSYRVEDSAERTTQLAANRTIFAAERTYAAWVRTGLVAMASGIGAKALLTGLIPQWLVTATGSVLVLFSAFCFGAAVWRHIYPGAPPPQPDVPRIPPWLLVALNSFLALVALAALMGIWFERGGPS